MHIIIEGVDCTGKTSLVNHLKEKYNIEVVKFSQPKGDPYQEYIDFAYYHKTPAILDRFYLGELAYGPVKRGKSGLNKVKMTNIEVALHMHNTFNIYCFTNEEEIKKRFKTRGESFLTEDEIAPILHEYSKALKDSLLVWNKFNYLEDGEYKQIDEKIDKWLETLKQ
jgi:thymidylate kinase